MKNLSRFTLDALFQGVSSLFVLAYNSATVNFDDNPVNNTNNRVLRDSHRKYFLPRLDITSYNVLIDQRNFYDQPVNDQIKRYHETRKLAAGEEMIKRQMFARLSLL